MEPAQYKKKKVLFTGSNRPTTFTFFKFSCSSFTAVTLKSLGNHMNRLIGIEDRVQNIIASFSHHIFFGISKFQEKSRRSKHGKNDGKVKSPWFRNLQDKLV